MSNCVQVLEKNKEIRHDWQTQEVLSLMTQPLNDLLFQAQSIHRKYFDANTVQLSTLLNIKRGGCPEDCAYCPQSARYKTVVKGEPILSLDEIRNAAENAKREGATRFCMGAAWRSPKERDFKLVLDMVKEVKAMGMETCVTMGMLNEDQTFRLKQAGLDFYNHNLDCSESFYETIISTRDYRDRLETLARVRKAGINVCSGGIIGMGEGKSDRAEMLCTLANLEKHPESVPINLLVKVKGTPLADVEDLDPFDMVRMIATARIMMPAAYVRLSAGRSGMNDEHQALCFMAGANSIFYGEELLTTDNPALEKDRLLFDRLGINALQ
ncbi:MAG: biotin synthase BioB [Gammaproteobacteria bacterium]|nr:MAG: biotin synthase BioB [Gammaproteobacteria bacterium]